MPNRNQPELTQALLRRGASAAYVIPTEAVTMPAGAAGAIVNFNLANGPIANAAGNDLGSAGDTSLALTSTAMTTETKQKPDADLANGEFWVDYLTGEARGKKASTATTGGTAVYKILVLKTMADPFDDLITANLSDSVDLTNGIARGLLCTAPGNVVIITAGGSTQTIPMVAGDILSCRVKRVKLTSTTATVLAGY